MHEEWVEVREQCWSDNTKRSRRSQWNIYFKFCNEFNLTPVPADLETIGLYITYLTRKCCYVTIINYLSGVWALHDYWGVPHLDPKNFLIKSTLLGAKRILGCESVQADPLSPDQLVKIWGTLDMNKKEDLQMWCALTLMYRCLLRVGHIVNSPHSMRVKDIIWKKGGCDVVIRSSKTIQFKERKLTVPLLESPGSVLCPCGYIRYYLNSYKCHPEMSLFQYTYSVFNKKLKSLCKTAGLQGNFSTHSLRRGSATFLSSFLPMHVVKTYGDWKSWAVLLYISDDYAARRQKDLLVAKELSNYV